MSIAIDLNEKQLNEVLQMHYLPAKIDGDGPTSVEDYFNVYTKQQDEIRPGLLSNSLRGYPLLGEQLNVPSGYKGLVVQETSKPLNETTDRKLRVTGTFDSFTYWNYDKIPTKADAYKQALQLLEVTDALSQPVADDEFKEELERCKIKRESKENK